MDDGRSVPKKRARLASDLAIYPKKAGRKAQKAQEPNDRGYDHALQRKLRRMRPQDVDALMRDGDDDTPSTPIPAGGASRGSGAGPTRK
jgi:hypothetical protein